MFRHAQRQARVIAAVLFAALLAGCGKQPPKDTVPESYVDSTAIATGYTTHTSSTTRNTDAAPSATSPASTITVATTTVTVLTSAIQTPATSTAIATRTDDNTTATTAADPTTTTTTAEKTTVTTTAKKTTTTTTRTTTKRTTTTTRTTLGAGVFTDIHRLQAGKSYTVKGIRLFSVRSTDNAFAKIQGGYFDGETYYIAALRKRSNGYEDTRILVVSKKGKLLRESEPLSLDHANNITYNPTLDRLVVSHCHSPDGHYYRYSLVDPRTLTITKTADKNQPFFAMAYSPEKQKYASARWNGEILDFWDKDMNHLQARSVTQPGSLSQGVFCDSEGVYFVRSAQNGYGSELRIYDWNGNLKLATPLQLADDYEPECINIVGDTTYIIADDWKGNAVVYILRFKEK